MRVVAVMCVALLVLSGQTAAASRPPAGVFPSLARNLVAYYDFEHPVKGSPGQERDQGRSGTDIELVNGGADMRVRDGFGRHALETKQVSPDVRSTDDWKAGVYSTSGVLTAFNEARQATVMGWFKMTGANPALNSNSDNPSDRYGAIGLAGLLSGDSDGHAVRALLELITVDGTMRVVALGRRIDGGSSQTFAASADWQTLLPQGEWVNLAATFDYDTGAMALYRNGKALPGFYVLPGDPWVLAGPPEPDLASATDPRGIKIGGSFPQNNREGNACNCRMDNLMFLNRALSPKEVWLQYHWAR